MAVVHTVEEAGGMVHRHFALCYKLLLPLHLHKHSLSIPQMGVGQMEQPDQGMVGEFHLAGMVAAGP